MNSGPGGTKQDAPRRLVLSRQVCGADWNAAAARMPRFSAPPRQRPKPVRAGRAHSAARPATPLSCRICRWSHRSASNNNGGPRPLKRHGQIGWGNFDDERQTGLFAWSGALLVSAANVEPSSWAPESLRPKSARRRQTLNSSATSRGGRRAGEMWAQAGGPKRHVCGSAVIKISIENCELQSRCAAHSNLSG